MLRTRRRQVLTFLGAVAVIGASAFASQYVWREAGLKSLQAVNEQRVQLVANALTAEVGRQDHLPVVLSLDPDVRNALSVAQRREPGACSVASSTVVSREADTRALYLIAPNGIVVASDDWQAPDYAGRPQSCGSALFQEGGRKRQEQRSRRRARKQSRRATISPKRCGPVPTCSALRSSGSSSTRSRRRGSGPPSASW